MKEQNRSPEAHVTETRRQFHVRMIQLLGAAITAIVAAPASLYLLLRPKSSDMDDLVEVADMNQLESGMPQEVIYYRTRQDGWKEVREKTTAWVVKRSDEDAVAFDPACPHLGCIYHFDYDSDTFECPCHASSFSADGERLEGPAPRGLTHLVTRIEGGMLLVGKPKDEEA